MDTGIISERRQNPPIAQEYSAKNHQAGEGSLFKDHSLSISEWAVAKPVLGEIRH